jgi:hypothetical protein
LDRMGGTAASRDERGTAGLHAVLQGTIHSSVPRSGSSSSSSRSKPSRIA